ncbi:folate-binding protein [Synechococcus sp. RSCCF101]|uniref:CAF17-like 4Fe-4S cluster assembly/insertion protein YgfZ n=1 Tax=Synechococcus sp. RSCCF101 TaxID=2511069 RepID=UPI001246CBEE|nr:folate-binding protein [Synechococcus sp. RSCCF101]QEY32297.1 folate-binding protein [Synechococcus sp. RSCCF101]
MWGSDATAVPPSSLRDPWQWRPGPGRCLERTVSLIDLRGPDARRFLHGQSSADLMAAGTGCWIPACSITPTGRMLGRLRIRLSGEAGESATVLVESGDADAIHTALDRVLFPADRVDLDGVRPARQRLELAENGQPGAMAVMAAEEPLPDSGLRPLNPVEQERWRIQWGQPAWPAEINDAHNPFELGLADAVSLSKGCYVGQETLAKLATYDGVRQQLRRWWCPVPDEGSDSITAGTVLQTPAGDRAGTITSVLTLPPGADGPAVGEAGVLIGLAMVRRAALGEPALRLSGAQGAGSGPAVELQLSRTAGFVEPPVGAGSGAR